MPTPVEFWFEFASPYSYLSVARIEAVAEAAHAPIVWKPFLLGPIFKAQGWDDSPFNLYAAKGRYMWRDVERLAEGYGLPFQRPSAFPRNGLLAARVALVGHDEEWGPAFTRSVYKASFAHDLDLAAPAVISDLLEGLGQDAGAVLARADADANKERLRAQTEEAVEKGIFGAPSFVVGDELYWGNDRLGDAIAKSLLG